MLYKTATALKNRAIQVAPAGHRDNHIISVRQTVSVVFEICFLKALSTKIY